jgi:hypothetical protein
MIDDTPYIIVDNQRIQPISRTPRSNPAGGEPQDRQDQNFGVVDRVTISREGREKARQQIKEEVPQLPATQSRLTQRPHFQLTYSPKGKP